MRYVTIFAFAFALAGAAWGHGGNVNDIPNGSVNSCDTCHLNDDFGEDFSDAGEQWTVALAAMDSDGDGYSNGTELLDPDGAWSEGDPDPGDPDDVTNPDDPGDHPTAVGQASLGETKANFR